MIKSLSYKQIENAVTKYKSDPSVTCMSLATECGCSAAAIARHLRLRIPHDEYVDLKLLRNPTHPGKAVVVANREKADARRKAAKVRVNHSAFAGTLNPEKAYWLGFLMADGCVTGKTGTRICLGLQERDRSHVEKFRSFVAGVYYKVTYVPSNKSCNLRFVSAQMAKDLLYYGIVPRKSLCDSFAINIPTDLLSHYVRGIFDGDGSLHGDANNRPVVQITAGNVFNTKLLVALKGHGIIGGGPYPCKDSLATVVMFQNIQASKLLHWMYDDANEDTVLERKHNKFLVLNTNIEDQRSTRKKTHETKI